ncbi:MAG TPA: PQQ-dependent sugar dehydrogenase [Verrucomicrobiae bacterium]|nr:PQQ-dependent sugar dehydrogenase [Verrucomicrobiae bacterium]
MTKRFSFPLLFAGLFSILPFATHAQPLPKIKLQPIFKSMTLDRPIWMCQAPGDADHFYVIEETGRILILQKGSDGSQAKEFMNIKARSPFIENGQNTSIGLLGLAFHPGFATNRLFYVLYSQPNSNKTIPFPNRTIISEFKTSASNPDEADLSSERVLLDIPEPFKNNIGGQMSFGPDGFLYISLGDGGSNNDPYGSGQNPGSLLSKILRVDVNSRSTTGSGKNEKELPYGIPSDNPWVDEVDMGNSGARKEMYAWGLRNIWRFSWDSKTGNLWGGDVGERLWEEVDLIVKGGNYGWNVREGAHHFKPGASGAQFIDPVIEYPHSPKLLPESQFPKHGIGVCVIGGYVYRGAKYPALDGVYLYADFGLGTIFGLRYDEGKVTDYGTLLEQPKNIVSFAEDADGELYVLTLIDHNDGHIFAVEAE